MANGVSQGYRDSERHSEIENVIQSLEHARNCYYCVLIKCNKMKRVLHHSKKCQRKAMGGCPLCKQLVKVCCYHARHCVEKECPVWFCTGIKLTLKQKNSRNSSQSH